MAAPTVASSVLSALGSATSRTLNAHGTRDAGDLLLNALYQSIGSGRGNEPITDTDFCRLGAVIVGEQEFSAYARIASDDATDNISFTWGGGNIFNFAEGLRITGAATSQFVYRVGKPGTGTGSKMILPGMVLPSGRDYTVVRFGNTGAAVSRTEPEGWTQIETEGGFFAYKQFPGGGTVPVYEAGLSASTEWGGFLIAIANEYTAPSEEVEPVVIGTKETTVGSNATSITGALPNGSDVAGRRLLAEGVKDGNGAITWPAGWQPLYDGVDGDNLNRVEIRYRDLAGGEYASEGATVKLEGASETWVFRSWLIEEGTFDPEQIPAIDSARKGEGNADPPNLKTPWGTATALWIAGCAVDSAASQSAPSAYPTNYSLNQYGVVTSATTDSVIYASAARKLKAAEENPATFTNRNDGNVGWTIAIKGAVGGPSPYRTAVEETEGLLHYWPLSANDGDDVIGSADATLSGTSGVSKGSGPLEVKDEGATDFDGSDTGQASADLSSLSAITLEFWMLWDAFSDNDDLAFEYTSNYNAQSGFIVDPNSASGGGGMFEFGFAVGTGAPETGGGHWTHRFARPSAEAWHHYVLVMDRSGPSNKAYVDGVSVSLTTTDEHAASYGNFPNSVLNFMCRNGASLVAAGELAHVAIYEGALSKATVEEHYEAAAKAPEPEPEGAWELSFDSGLNDGEGAKSYLGVLGGELYLFGSSNESAGDMAGVHRFRGGEWEQLYEGGGEDFNGFATYGASAYKGKLYVGDRRKGRLYRLDLDEDGDFSALTDVGGEAFVGSEDVFPGPVVWGRLYLGTFGNAFNPGLGLEPPGLYRFDGTTVTQILELEDIEIAGEVTSIVVYEGEVWCSAVNGDRDYCEIWRVAEDDSSTLMYSGTTIYSLAVLGGQLVGATYENEEVEPGAESRFVVWDGSEFDPLAGPWSVQVGSEFCKVVGDQLWGSDYYYGITAYDGEGVENIGMGAWVNDPLESSPTSEAYGGALAVKVHGGYVWVATQQPVKVWRLELPAPEASAYVFDGTELVPATRSIFDGSKLVEA